MIWSVVGCEGGELWALLYWNCDFLCIANSAFNLSCLSSSWSTSGVFGGFGVSFFGDGLKNLLMDGWLGLGWEFFMVLVSEIKRPSFPIVKILKFRVVYDLIHRAGSRWSCDWSCDYINYVSLCNILYFPLGNRIIADTPVALRFAKGFHNLR